MTNIELHGIGFDSESMTLYLPADKKSRALAMIDELCKLTKVQVKRIQQIHGLLNFACKAVPPDIS